jgi:hypothetical protein
MMQRLFLALILVLALLSPSCSSLIPDITSFKVIPDTITEGQSAKLLWHVTGASSVSIDPVGVVAPSGEQTVKPSTTTAYTISASGFAGTVSKSVVLKVTPRAITIDFNINPATLMSGGIATLSWNVAGATTVLIDQGIGEVPPTGSKSVNPQVTTTYTLTASNPGNSGTASVTIAVNQPISVSFTANPTATFSGQGSILKWDTTGATSVSIDQGVGDVPTSGSVGVIPYTTTTYTITASSPCCLVTKSITITVGDGYPTFPWYWYPYWWYR